MVLAVIEILIIDCRLRLRSTTASLAEYSSPRRASLEAKWFPQRCVYRCPHRPGISRNQSALHVEYSRQVVSRCHLPGDACHSQRVGPRSPVFFQDSPSSACQVPFRLGGVHHTPCGRSCTRFRQKPSRGCSSMYWARHMGWTSELRSPYRACRHVCSSGVLGLPDPGGTSVQPHKTAGPVSLPKPNTMGVLMKGVMNTLCSPNSRVSYAFGGSHSSAVVWLDAKLCLITLQKSRAVEMHILGVST